MRSPSQFPTRGALVRGRFTWLAVVLVLSLQACDEDKAPTAPALAEPQSPGVAHEGERSVAAQGTIPLPIDQTFSGGLAFGITQAGTGRAGLFRVRNANSLSDALNVVTNSASAAGLKVVTDGGGRAGHFLTTSATNFAPVIEARTEGLGPAGSFVNNNPNNIDAALRVFTRGGRGDALQASITGFDPSHNPAVGRFIVTVGGNGTGVDASNSGSGSAGVFRIQNGPNGSSALRATTIGPGWAGDFQGQGKGVRIQTNGGTGLSVLGGSKQAVVSTATGARSLYSEEASEVWFADYGFAKLEDGRARILIDPGFAQTVNLDVPYHVFVQPYGRAELYVDDRTNLGFVVRAKDGDLQGEFGYRIVAKRRGFEAARLERAAWADDSPVLEH